MARQLHASCGACVGQQHQSLGRGVQTHAIFRWIYRSPKAVPSIVQGVESSTHHMIANEKKVIHERRMEQPVSNRNIVARLSEPASLSSNSNKERARKGPNDRNPRIVLPKQSKQRWEKKDSYRSHCTLS